MSEDENVEHRTSNYEWGKGGADWMGDGVDVGWVTACWGKTEER